MNFTEIAQNRYSCRSYDATKMVEDEKIKDVVAANILRILFFRYVTLKPNTNNVSDISEDGEIVYSFDMNNTPIDVNTIKKHNDFSEKYLQEIFYNIPLPLCKGRKCPLNLLVQGLIYKAPVGIRGVTVYKHVQKAVVLTVNKRSINRHMSSRNSQCICNLLSWDLKDISKLLWRRHTLVLLLKV